MTELPFSEFVSWLEARCEGGWSIDRREDGEMVLSCVSLAHGMLVARNGEFWKGASKQLADCCVQLAVQMGVEA